MHINFSKEMEQFLKMKVSSGFYTNTSDVIRDAIRKMEAEDKMLGKLKAAVAVADAQIANGAISPYTPSFINEKKQKAIDNSKAGKKVNPDVTP